MLINALPEPDFKYFSKLKALYLLETTKYISSVLGVISHDNDSTLEDISYQFSLINTGHILEPISCICDKLKELEIETSLGKKITVRD